MSYEILAFALLLYAAIICCGLLYVTLNRKDRKRNLESASPPAGNPAKEQRKIHRAAAPNIMIIRGVTVVAICYAVYYLIWRLTTTFNPNALWLSWLLWGAEAYGLLIFLMFAFLTWRLVHPVPPKPRDGIAVDVFIATCGEPIDILRATLASCGQIRYPHTTYMLDDVGREEVRQLAASLGARYITRSNRKGAKAGAINNALKQSQGELVGILDADHIPLPTFLDDTIGFFEDNEIAIVQGPQLFYNLDSFEHNRSPWHEQRMFFHVIQPGKNVTKSAFWAGTPSVLRRSAIEAIGGIAEETVTEDLHTSIRLIRGGYRILYIDRPLAAGLAPATAEDFLGQRFRWAQGAMQIFRLDNPLTSRGFTLGQRISFFASMETYFDALQKLILFLIPLIVLTTGILPISTFTLPFWLRFIPYIFLMFISNWLLGRGTYNIWDVLRYDTVKMFTFIAALPALVTGRTRPFRVTSKEAGSKTRSPFQLIVAPHWIFIGLTVFGIGMGIANLIHPFLYVQQPVPLIIATVWGVFDLVLMISVVRRLTGVSRRVRYRFAAQVGLRWQLAGEYEWHPAQSIDLSASGLGFNDDSGKLRPGDQLKINIPGNGRGEINLTCSVMGARPDNNGVRCIGLAIQEFAGGNDADRYMQLVYSPEGLLYGEDPKAPYLADVPNQPWRRLLNRIRFAQSRHSSGRRPPDFPVPIAIPIADSEGAK